MKFIKIDATVEEQIEKVKEEVQEFYDAVENKDSDNTIEEFYDVIQSMLGVISLRGLENALQDGLNKHNKKLISRDWDMKPKKKITNPDVSNYILAVHFLIDKLEYMMEDEDFNTDKLQKRIDVVNKFEKEL